MTKADKITKGLKLSVPLGDFHRSCPIRLRLEAFGSARMADKCAKEVE